MSTEAQKRASTNYNRKQDNIMVRPTKEEGAAIRAAAASAGQSVQAYVLQAIRERMEREPGGGRFWYFCRLSRRKTYVVGRCNRGNCKKKPCLIEQKITAR